MANSLTLARISLQKTYCLEELYNFRVLFLELNTFH